MNNNPQPVTQPELDVLLNKEYAQETVSNYGQVLTQAIAFNIPPDRLKLMKMQELSGIKTDTYEVLLVQKSARDK